MRGRLIKIALMFFVVILLSAITNFVSRVPQSLETLSAQVHMSAFGENDPALLAPPFREFVSFMEEELDSSNTVGAAYTIVHRGEIIYTGTYGVLENGSQLKVDEHTLFRMASVSKGFAGVLATMLDQDGAFSLNDRVVEHYPGFALKDSVNTADLTIRNLLSHTSGLVPYAFDNLVEADQDLYTIIERLDEVDISAPPGELYGYQNVMFSMLDPIARKATGIPYQVLLKEKIFTPLGMKDASAGPVNLEQNPNMAYPHVRTKNGYAALHPHEGYYNVLPAAGVNASISDMGQWLLALLGYKPEWMSDSVLNSISTPVIYTPLKWRYTRYWKPFRERYYSLGWRIYNYQGRQIIYHGGYIRGYRAEIAFCPSEDVGIAFMQNSPNSLASRCVPAFIDLYLE
ncbi:MAG: serine hydrolase domain-containing protein [Bacteroidota bacterium]|nr:serine hydrolase domain-containing protein [Bacteroidota bacterium]